MNANNPMTCILCLDEKSALTKEHVFPQSVGGTIVREILCKECNSKLGQFVDAPYTKQKPIELARAVHRQGGKTGTIPQPFSDVYIIETNGKQKKIRIDNEFKPRVVPKAPEISVTDNGQINLQLSRDVQDRAQIPSIIRTTLSRFFKSSQGSRLGWSTEEQERVINELIEKANLIEPVSEHIEVPLHGRWSIDLNAIFAEHVKVIYEICCLEFGQAYIYSEPAQKIRLFLSSLFSGSPVEENFHEKAMRLGVVPQLPEQIKNFINHITCSSGDRAHVAIAQQEGVICSMLGMGALYSVRGIKELAVTDGPRVYLSSIDNGISGVFSLRELLRKSTQTN